VISRTGFPSLHILVPFPIRASKCLRRKGHIILCSRHPFPPSWIAVFPFCGKAENAPRDTYSHPEKLLPVVRKIKKAVSFDFVSQGQSKSDFLVLISIKSLLWKKNCLLWRLNQPNLFSHEKSLRSQHDYSLGLAIQSLLYRFYGDGRDFSI
jgi:hypothetical protein